jgi:hypothetical protein
VCTHTASRVAACRAWEINRHPGENL